MQPNHRGPPPPSPWAQQPWAPAPNPYAAGAAGPLYRENVFAPYGATAGPLVKPTLRTIKLALGIAQLVFLGGAIASFIAFAVLDDGNGGGQVPGFLGFGALGLWYFTLFGYAVTNLLWIHQFWSWIPPQQRYTSMWRKYISPGAAAGFLLIPYFNIYWMFVVYLGIADILERMRVQFPTPRPSARTLAILATVIPILFFPAAPVLQFLFARHVEAMATDMQQRMGPAFPAV